MHMNNLDTVLDSLIILLQIKNDSKTGVTFNQKCIYAMQSKTDPNDCPGFVFRQDGTNELSAHVFRALNKITSS